MKTALASCAPSINIIINIIIIIIIIIQRCPDPCQSRAGFIRLVW